MEFNPAIKFNPVIISVDRFKGILKEIKTLDKEKHELEIVEVKDADTRKGEINGYTLHVRAKPNFFEWILRIIFHTPETVRITNVASLLLNFVKENKEVIYKFNEEDTREFIYITTNYLNYYPQAQNTAAALGALVNQQHMAQEFKIDNDKLTNDNTRLTKEAREAKKKLEKYEKKLGTLTQMKENIANIQSKNEEFISLSKQCEALQLQVETSFVIFKDLDFKSEQAHQAKLETEAKTAQILQEIEASKAVLSKAKEKLAKTKQETDTLKHKTNAEVQQALTWAKEMEQEHERRQTEAREVVSREYVEQAYSDFYSQVKQEVENELKLQIRAEVLQEFEGLSKTAISFKEQIIQQAKKDAEAIKIRAQQEVEEKNKKANLEIEAKQRELDRLIAKQKEENNPPPVDDNLLMGF